MSLQKPPPNENIANLNLPSKKTDNFFYKLSSLGSKVPGFPYYLAILCFISIILCYYIYTRYRHLIHPLFKHLLPGAFSFLFVLFVTPLCIRTALKFRIVDKNTRQNAGKNAIPLLGGMAIYLSFLFISCIYQPWTPQMLSIIIGGSIIFIIGTIDDIKPISSIIRLIGQLIACIIVMKSGLVITFFQDANLGHIITYLTTLIWILGIINATNFVDGVDGLATGFAVISASFFLLITLHLEQFQIAITSSILIGSGLGFLIYNFKPAKIYLGDGGSTFLGFLLACIALYGGWSSWGPVISIGIPLLILGVLIFDMIYITISRIKNGSVKNFRQWLDYRGRDHFHHRLINLGFKEEEAVLFIYAICIILGLSALVIENARVSYPVVVLLIQATLIFILISMLMLKGRQLEHDKHE